MKVLVPLVPELFDERPLLVAQGLDHNVVVEKRHDVPLLPVRCSPRPLYCHRRSRSRHEDRPISLVGKLSACRDCSVSLGMTP
jgi:hypothetical protein